jgi:hypothetical protein
MVTDMYILQTKLSSIDRCPLFNGASPRRFYYIPKICFQFPIVLMTSVTFGLRRVGLAFYFILCSKIILYNSKVWGGLSKVRILLYLFMTVRGT